MGNGGCKYICNFTRLFYCANVDFEVADGNRISFPADASYHMLDLFHGSLTSQFEDNRISSSLVCFAERFGELSLGDS